jgi:hypothetical protein
VANANPASAAPKKTPKAPVEESKGPKIEYFGVGAEKVKFTVDPKATSIRVYANGLILTDY